MLAVTGIGMVSPLGLDVVSSCAAARAGIRRIVEIDDFLVKDAEGTEIAPVAVHRVPLISAGFFGFARLRQLGAAALADLLGATGSLDGERLGFILMVGGETYRRAWLTRARKDPEVAAGADLEAYDRAVRASEQRIGTDLGPALIDGARLKVPDKARRIVTATGAAFVGALQVAEEWLAKGICERCLVGGLDSLLDPTTLQALEWLRLLKTPDRPAALMPGEAACFLSLEGPRARRGTVLATLEAPGWARGPAHPLLEEGEGRDALAVAISQTLAGLSDAGRSTGLSVVNLNGDPHRAIGWGDAFVRALMPLQLGDLPLWIPPLYFGEVGAAAGPISVALLARGRARGYAPSPNTLVALMDDFGGRGTFYARARA
jgi:hypothetical protein